MVPLWCLSPPPGNFLHTCCACHITHSWTLEHQFLPASRTFLDVRASRPLAIKNVWLSTTPPIPSTSFHSDSAALVKSVDRTKSMEWYLPLRSPWHKVSHLHRVSLTCKWAESFDNLDHGLYMCSLFSSFNSPALLLSFFPLQMWKLRPTYHVTCLSLHSQYLQYLIKMGSGPLDYILAV